MLVGAFRLLKEINILGQEAVLPSELWGSHEENQKEQGEERVGRSLGLCISCMVSFESNRLSRAEPTVEGVTTVFLRFHLQIRQANKACAVFFFFFLLVLVHGVDEDRSAGAVEEDAAVEVRDP
ncbi:hypothetical protein MUK42_30284 [Musa troglodytarum]|uniref:Uncharacterized protein n=1 Tax=Musa troglodytarum TaxID=320322 RepID=A0A9E7FRK9_9LILI|nr:hypothetical protein MUK42_30284 [Musa troglodytarum]